MTTDQNQEFLEIPAVILDDLEIQLTVLSLLINALIYEQTLAQRLHEVTQDKENL